MQFRILVSTICAILVATPTSFAQTPRQERQLIAGLEARVQNIVETVSPFVVKFTEISEPANQWSGTIVSADGIVASCAHHQLKPGETANVMLTDGRAAMAEVLGFHEELDICFLKIVSKTNDWPHAKIGNVSAVRNDDLCVEIAFPALEAPASVVTPSVRLGRIASTVATPVHLVSTCRGRSGDSGGGLFNLDGELIGIRSTGDRITVARTNHIGAGLFLDYWEALLQPQELKLPNRKKIEEAQHRYYAFNNSQANNNSELRLGSFAQKLEATIANTKEFAVEVLCNGEQKAFGTVYNSSGLVVTKASLLFGEVSCRLIDGNTFPAKKISESHDYDLALLQIDTNELPTVQWSEAAIDNIGTLVAVPGSAYSPIATGIISHPTRKIPGIKGTVFASIQSLSDLEQKPVVSELTYHAFPPTFVEDDIIQSLEGTPTPTLRSMLELNGGPDNGRLPGKFVGDRIQATVRRENKDVSLEFHLDTLRYPKHGDLFPIGRSSGFPNAFSIDAFLLPERCGGPVVNRQGRVVGVVISPSWDYHETYVIPANSVHDLFKAEQPIPKFKLPPETSDGFPADNSRLSMNSEITDLQASTLLGEQLKLSEYQGKWVVLCLWSLYSELCVLQIPELVELNQELAKQTQPLQFLSLYVDRELDQSEWKKSVEKQRIPWPVAKIDHHTRIQLLTRHLAPGFVVVSPAGELAFRGHRLSELRSFLSKRMQ